MHRQRSDSGGSRHPSVVDFAAQPTYTVALKGSTPAAAAATNDDDDANQGHIYTHSDIHTHIHTHSGGEQRQHPSHPSQHKSFAHALLPDLPLLMHGSGDVLPELVHPHSVATLAKLIEGYVASLVGAAMDAHDVFTDGEVVGGGACLGVPPYRLAAGGGDSDDDSGDDYDGMAARRRSKKRKKIDYWDVPLPPPAAAADGGDSSCGDSEISSDDSDDDVPLGGLRRLSSPASNSSVAEISSLAGFAPVDLHANERARMHYVAAPTAMDVRSFIFPICHDAVLYQRVKEVQASRRSIGRDLVDPVVMDAMKEEGATIGRWGAADMWDAVLGGRAGNDEDYGDGVAGTSVTKKKGGDKTSDKDKDKDKGAEKTKASPEEKKGEGGDRNLVSAGLVDADVNPSWPGLNALARGKLW